jgi:ATP-dependent Clp protease ATP-binding subunit ClpA
MESIEKELAELHNVIIFIGELHMLLEAGSPGSLGAAEILRVISRANIPCISETTRHEYPKLLLKI